MTVFLMGSNIVSQKWRYSWMFPKYRLGLCKIQRYKLQWISLVHWIGQSNLNLDSDINISIMANSHWDSNFVIWLTAHYHYNQILIIYLTFIPKDRNIYRRMKTMSSWINLPLLCKFILEFYTSGLSKHRPKNFDNGLEKRRS